MKSSEKNILLDIFFSTTSSVAHLASFKSNQINHNQIRTQQSATILAIIKNKTSYTLFLSLKTHS